MPSLTSSQNLSHTEFSPASHVINGEGLNEGVVDGKAGVKGRRDAAAFAAAIEAAAADDKDELP